MQLHDKLKIVAKCAILSFRCAIFSVRRWGWMKAYPVYQDAVAYSNMAKGQFPFYISLNRFENTSLHYHDFAEFSFVIDGHGTETINGVPHAFRPGTATLLLPHHYHEIHSNPGSSIYKYCCMFSIGILSDLSQDSSVYHLLWN